jgi:hypothetical protein
MLVVEAIRSSPIMALISFGVTKGIVVETALTREIDGLVI